MNVPSLSGFLALSDAKYRLFDLGTQLRPLPNDTLASLDQGLPYPHPYLGYGWLVIFSWHPQVSEQNSLWFLKLPLDEQGIVSAAAHGELVNRLYRSLQTDDAQERQRLLTDHLFHFKPDTDKMAALHATATALLGLPASEYLPTAEEFLLSNKGLIDWQSIGLQGIADFVVRASEADLGQLAGRLTPLAEAPFIALTGQLEHRNLSTSLVSALIAKAQLDPNQIAIENACLRACSQSTDAQLCQALIDRRLSGPDVSLEFLLIVLSRYSNLLQDTDRALLIMDQLAQLADADGFHRLVTHLVMQPGLAQLMRTLLGHPRLTPALANAIALLLQTQRSRHVQH
jgi:hypothetical protein